MKKITIQAHKNPKMTDSPLAFFELPINPENMTRTFKIQRDESQAPGTQKNDAKFKKTENEELKFDFILDATNTVEGYLYEAKSISKQLDKFLEVVYKMNGDKREPNVLKIIWGAEFVFECQMSSLNVTYSLFDPTGLPLRAKLSVSFNSYMESEKRVILEDKKLGTLTTVQNLVTKPKLGNIAHDVYSDANVYLQIAKANNMVNFRSLKDAVNLVLPPVQKTIEQVSNTVNNATSTANNINNTLNKFRQ
jgi:Contractile injection system tube protein